MSSKAQTGIRRGLAIAGDFYHDASSMRRFISSASPDSLVWDWYNPAPSTDKAILNLEAQQLDYDVIVIAAENRVEPEESDQLWMSEELALWLKNWVHGGGGLIGLHNGLASYENLETYINLVGGGFTFHPKPHPKFDIVPVPGTADHPLMQGVGQFSLTDELYFVERYTETTEVLAVTECPRFGGSSAFWYREPGKGKVVCLTPGHLPETQANPSLKRMLSNSINWCLRSRS